MEIRQFTYVNMVAECGSMTKAAAKLFITQPALSNYISKLEEELGTKLFDRSVTPMKLTFAGEKYLEHAKTVMLQIDNMEREIRDITKHRTGRLRLGFPNERIIYMLPALLPVFHEKYPGVRIETNNAPGVRLLDFLTDGDVDFVFLPGWEKRKGIISHPISQEELILVAKKGYIPDECLLDPKKRIFNWNHISDFPLFTLKKGHALRSSLDLLCERTGKTPNICMETHSNMLSCRLAAQGLGVALVPEISMEILKKDLDAEWYHLLECPVSWDVNIYYREDAYLGTMEHDLIRMAEDVFGKRKLWKGVRNP